MHSGVSSTQGKYYSIRIFSLTLYIITAERLTVYSDSY